MTTRIFLHSPSEAPDALDIAVRMPEFECLGERALLLARPGDVVCLARPVDARHLGFLQSLGIGPRPEDILVFDGVRPGTGLSARIATDGPSLDRLARRLRKTEALELVPFFATPATETLARSLRSRLGRSVRVAGGPASLVRRLHEKSVGCALARALGIPVAPGDVVRIPGGAGRADLVDLRRAVLHRSGPTGRAVLRGSSGASGSSTFVVEPGRVEEVLDAVAGRTGDPVWLVEPLYESLVSPNVEVVVERSDAGGLRLGITDQILDRDLAYRGSVHPSRARRQDRMLEDARTIATWMRRKGFRGRAGFDFVEHVHRGRVRHFLAEINPRVNGASYPLALYARLGRLAGRLGGPVPMAFLSRTIPVAIRDYAELERHLGDRLYDPRRGEGIVPWSPGALEAGKIGVACLAGTRSRVTELLDGMRAALAILAALAALLSPTTVPAQDPPSLARPTVGLVLSGGGARGLAHIGVLELLEELRVPIDLVAGTSMGAIVGGLYASGLSPAEIRAILEDLEWERILADTPPRAALDVSRRAESRRYAFELELGLSRDGLMLPSGVVAGQDLGLLLRRTTLPIATVEEFSGLPIPFAAVAADIATGERVVLDRGDLVQAMRASMAIPVVFSPIERDGRLLVDGGLVDNLPVSLARSMGADVVIAVDVTPPLKDRAELRDLFGISEQLVILLGQQDVQQQLSLADVGLDLEMQGVGIFDFRAADSIMARGTRAARNAASDLARWSLPESEYVAHLDARRRRVPALPGRTSGLRIDGPAWLDERIVLTRVDPALEDTLDPDLLEKVARELYALGEFERVEYDLAQSETGPAIVIRPIAKARGPHVLRLGADLTTDSAGDGTAILTFQGLAGYVRKRIGARGAEWRVDLAAGTTTGLETAFRRPLDFAGRWFLEASGRAVEIERAVFVGEAIDTGYETRLAEAAVHVGRAIGLSTEARIGLAWGRASSELGAPVPELATRFPRSVDDVAELRAALVVDRIDALNLPRRGVFGRAAVRASREELGADRAWTRLELEGRVYGSRGPHTGFGGFAGGASSPAASLPVREEFLLGGFGSLSGFGDGELRGEAFLVARAGWLRRLAELPPALRAIVAGGWIEAGDAWDPSRDQTPDFRSAVTAAVGAETLIGPVFVSVTRADGGRGRLAVSLGRSP